MPIDHLGHSFLPQIKQISDGIIFSLFEFILYIVDVSILPEDAATLNNGGGGGPHGGGGGGGILKCYFVFKSNSNSIIKRIVDFE